MTIRRPAILLTLGLAVVLGLVGCAGWLATRLPALGITVSSRPDGPISVIAMSGKPAASNLPATLLGVAPIEDGRPVVRVDGKADAVRRADRLLTKGGMVVQDQLRQLFDAGSVRLWLQAEDGSRRWERRAIGEVGLGGPFWINALATTAAAAIALWLLVLRPRSGEVRAIAASGAGLSLAALPFAILANGEFVIGGQLWHALVMLNWASSLLFGGGLIAFFLLFPAPLIGGFAYRTALTAIAVVSTAAIALVVPMWVGTETIGTLVLADAVIIMGLIGVQWRRSRRDPVGRTGLRLIGSATAVTIALFLLVTYVPPLFGEEASWADTAVFLGILPIYLAVALCVTRGELLDLDRWSWRLASSALALLALVGGDIILSLGAGMAGTRALSMTILLVGAAWLVLRQSLWQRWMSSRQRDGSQLFEKAPGVALAGDPERQFAAWRGGLQDFFQPLQITELHPIDERATVTGQGLQLRVPAPTFGPSLLLHAARGGRSLFSAEDARLVDAFARLCEQGVADRAAYDRGIREERGRIARDLHDDISSRLLTSLHREDPIRGRLDVREALQEIRSLVVVLQDQPASAEEMLASARYEAGERLEVAGVSLDWPIPVIPTGASFASLAAAKSIERAIREAITNVIRHAQASRVAVRCAARSAEKHGPGLLLCIDIQDDGCGIDPARTGHGLRNIRSRLEELGGDASIGPPHDGARGTLVRLRVPMRTP